MTRPRWQHWCALAGALVVCGVAVAGYASARRALHASRDQSHSAAAVEGGSRVTPGARPATSGPAKRRLASAFPMDPNARWACDRQTVTADPVWRGNKYRLSFDFDIRNEGTADLRIKASGG